MSDRYRVFAIWSNGENPEAVTKDCPTKKSVIGAASLLLREVRPFQIVITDLQYKDPMPSDLQKIAESLNNK